MASPIETQLIHPAYYEFSIPPTVVQAAGINLKTQPMASFREFVREGAILGRVDGLDDFFIVFPAKQYFPEQDGTHVFVVPLYDRPVDYLHAPGADLVHYWNYVLPHIRKGTSVIFNEASNCTRQTAQTFGNLHFQMLRFPQSQPHINWEYMSDRIEEPFAAEITELLAWHFQRPGFNAFTQRWGARIDNKRIEKTGFPSGGIVFTFEREAELDGYRLHSFMSELLRNYRNLHDYIFSTIVDRYGYLAHNDMAGDFFAPLVLPQHEAREEMNRYFFTKAGFPDRAVEFFEALYDVCRAQSGKVDLVVPYTVAVVQEMGHTELILDPHFYKIGGTIEMFGSGFTREIKPGAPLSARRTRAEAFAEQLAM